MSITINQIAELCGVSRGTVDRALHHKKIYVLILRSISDVLLRNMAIRPIGLVLHFHALLIPSVLALSCTLHKRRLCS